MARAKNFRRLRRAFFYRFVLQFRFWLQREANSQTQRRSSNALSSQIFLARVKNFALASLFRPFPQKARRGRSAAARSAALLPLSTKKIRRLRRAFLYHFILQFRFWLQGQAKNARPARRRRLARNASLALLFCKTASRCSKGRNCRKLKNIGACGALSFTTSFCNFASGCSEKQTPKNKVVAAARSARRLSL